MDNYTYTNDFERGQRAGMKSCLENELVNTNCRIELLEDQLIREKRRKWSIKKKLELVNMEGYEVSMILDEGEEWTLEDKILNLQREFKND